MLLLLIRPQNRWEPDYLMQKLANLVFRLSVTGLFSVLDESGTCGDKRENNSPRTAGFRINFVVFVVVGTTGDPGDMLGIGLLTGFIGSGLACGDLSKAQSDGCHSIASGASTSAGVSFGETT